jgi:hypothetical protein
MDQDILLTPDEFEQLMIRSIALSSIFLDDLRVVREAGLSHLYVGSHYMAYYSFGNFHAQLTPYVFMDDVISASVANADSPFRLTQAKMRLTEYVKEKIFPHSSTSFEFALTAPESEAEFDRRRNILAIDGERLYRSLTTEQSIGDREIASLFFNPHPLTVANGVEPTRYGLIRGMNNFNQKMTNGNISKSLRAHVTSDLTSDKEGIEYDNSGFASYTTDTTTAKSFLNPPTPTPLEYDGISLTIRRPREGALDLNQIKRLDGYRYSASHPGEDEVSIASGVLPEMIDEVKVYKRRKGGIRIDVEAKRLSWNRVEISSVPGRIDKFATEPELPPSTTAVYEFDPSTQSLRLVSTTTAITSLTPAN